MAEDKHWAKGYILDPLNEPQPSDETGPNAHFRSSFAPLPPDERPSVDNPPAYSARHSKEVPMQSTGDTISTNPYRRSIQSVTTEGTAFSHSRSSSQNLYPTPPSSASPQRSQFPSGPRHAKAASVGNPGSPRQDFGLKRGGSLRERYPGDMSHRPLDTLMRDQKMAHRSPHLRRRHLPGPDLIDRLDSTAMPYHHGGPFDAALLARNLSWENSPLAALRDSNREALKATPRENIEDSLRHHQPLDGVAIVPPGVPDRFGRIYKYEEGIDLNRERGADYKRWPGMQYHPDDLKGKGEPSYTIEKALKDHKPGETADGVEMSTRSRGKSLSSAEPQKLMPTTSIERSNTTGRSFGESIKRRVGSIRRRRVSQEV